MEKQKEIERNYEELEKRTILYYNGNYGFENGSFFKIGLVAGCDYDIGVTIINKYNKDEYLCCLLGPSAPNLSEYLKLNFPYDIYNELFAFRILAINEGALDFEIENRLYQHLRQDTVLPIDTSGSSSKSCSFNQ